LSYRSTLPVLDQQTDENGYVSVKLTDLAERVVKVHRLNPRSVFDSASESEQVLWSFDLASIEAKMQNGWRQPRNFHEVAATQTELTAWTLRVFLADPQGRQPGTADWRHLKAGSKKSDVRAS
jgi:hypothetical protein